MNNRPYSDSSDTSGKLPHIVGGLGGTATWTAIYTSWSCERAHRMVLEGLRGTNRNQRVETVRCLDCGRIERRVWLDLPAAKKPDRTYVLREAYSATVRA